MSSGKDVRIALPTYAAKYLQHPLRTQKSTPSMSARSRGRSLLYFLTKPLLSFKPGIIVPCLNLTEFLKFLVGHRSHSFAKNVSPYGKRNCHKSRSLFVSSHDSTSGASGLPMKVYLSSLVNLVFSRDRMIRDKFIASGATSIGTKLLNFAQSLVFTGLISCNEPENVHSRDPQLEIPPGGLVLSTFTSRGGGIK